ncbi:MAG: radical SAM protein [Lachnospiraceae bacterium]|nr:radical SAM protein [Lachnospiraceae bacterium]
MKKHVNIPFFIPHLGCPNACVFCDQHTISGAEEISPEAFTREAETILASLPPDTGTEIAFFGGSFTGIDRNYMLSLLSAADRFLEDGRVSSIRVSTRPDLIDPDVLSVLKSHGVKTVELGIQSTSDVVLSASKRGHSFADTARACALLLEAGFTVVGQMMIGLPGSTPEDEVNTAKTIVSLGCTGARIYPTVVLSGTELAFMAKSGSYRPLPLSEAVARSAAAYRVFLKNGVPVIRVGLCAGEQYRKPGTVAAGEYHPAIGELVQSRVMLDAILEALGERPSLSASDTLRIAVAPGFLSRVIGQGGAGRRELLAKSGAKRLFVTESASVPPFSFDIL